MKKLHTLMIILGALAGTATATEPAATTAATTPQWQKLVTIDVINNSATEDEFDIDTTGIRIAGSLYSISGEKHHHQFTLAIAPAWGSEEEPEFDYEQDVTITPITLGYSLNYDIDDKIVVYAGAKLGYIKATIEDNYGWEDDATGLTYGFGFGIKYMCTDKIFVQAGYEYNCATLEFNDIEEEVDYGSHTISAGVGFKF